MRILAVTLLLAACAVAFATASLFAGDDGPKKAKPTPDEAIQQLKEGNRRFVHGEEVHPNLTAERLKQAAREDQGDHAYATILTCSDSRVPVTNIFDAGIMDLFVIRVAGNVCGTDEIGSVEYGLGHVRTPVVVILGHSQCGAVTTVVRSETGERQTVEANIPSLLTAISPAVDRVLHREGAEKLSEKELVEASVVENVAQAMYDLFLISPTAREAVRTGKAKVVGAVYQIGTGAVEWLDEEFMHAALAKASKDPDRVTARMAEKHALDLAGWWEVQDSDHPPVRIAVSDGLVFFDCEEKALQVLYRGVLGRIDGDVLDLVNLMGRSKVAISEDGRTLTWPGGVVWKKR